MSPRGGGQDTRTSEYWGQATGLFALVFLAYSALAILAWASFGSALGPAFFFPSAGVTAAAMMLSRRALWPAIIVAIVAGEMLVDTYFGNPASVAAGFAVANVAEPLVGSSLVLALCDGRPDLRQRRDLFVFIGGACIAAPIIGGLIGGTVSALHQRSPWFSEVFHWSSGDGIGVLVVAAPILLWAKQSYLVRARKHETALVLAATAMLSGAAFWAEAPPSLLILPILLWAALRLDMLGAALAGAIIAFVANVMTTRGHGMFTNMDMPTASRVALTQVFVAVVTVTALLTAQEAAARMKAVRERDIEQRERVRLETLARLGQQLAAALTPADIGDALEDQVLNEAGARALNLGLVGTDGKTLEWVTMAGYPQRVIDEFGSGVAISERTVAGDAVRSGQPVLVRSSAEYARRYPTKVYWQQLTGTETTVGWPLSSGGDPIGVLVLAWSERQSLDAAQLAYVSAVATMVSQALVRARVYADEHARAVVLQSAVLPTSPADTLGLDLCVTYEPADVAQGLGGDWYDLMQVPKNRKYLAVGDVVGHGLPAVEDMAQLRSAARAMAHQGLSPSQLLAELNGFTRHASIGKFATMAVAILDAGTLSYGSAGHPPCLLRRAATGEVIRLAGAQGPVLGPLEDATYPEQTIAIETGDILVMYTDGLVEHRGADIDAGISRLEEIVAGWDSDTVLQTGCAVLNETLAPRPRGDDICIIAVRFSLEED